MSRAVWRLVQLKRIPRTDCLAVRGILFVWERSDAGAKSSRKSGPPKCADTVSDGRTTVRRAAPALSDQVLFLDVLEIAVRADFQFDGRGFVAYDDSVRVYLHGRNRADMRVGTFDALLQGAGFLVAERED